MTSESEIRDLLGSMVGPEVAGTVGPTTFPAAHSAPTPCGALVTSNGTAYSVKVPYTCGAVVPVK